MNALVNLTQHALVEEQKEGFHVVETNGDVRGLLTFNDLPTMEIIVERATALAKLAVEAGATHAVIGGAPYLMGALEDALLAQNIQPLYAFSIRESVETTGPDGQVVKTSVFKHAGWVEVKR